MLNILLYQYDILWEKPLENLDTVESNLRKWFAVKGTVVDIVVLPEFFTTGFTMDNSFAECEPGITLERMMEWSKEFDAAIVGSLPVRDGEFIYNRCYFVTPDGSVSKYDKRHLFRMSRENEVYSAGNEKVVVDFRGWKIALNICYDLRFPVWSRNWGAADGYDLMINVASWPLQRIEAAQILAKARAVENLSYFIFANRVGKSPSEEYSGGSMVIDFKGNDISEDRSVDGLKFLVAILDLEKLRKFREKFPAWMDAD